MAQSSSTPTRRIRERNRTRSWLLRLPILLWLVLVVQAYLVDPTGGTIWDGINLAFHEMGHIVFLAFPQVMTVAGGTILQLAVPLIAGWMLIRQQDDFGGAVALVWLGTNFMGVATYAGDARAQALPLVSPFPGEIVHDWAFLLGELGLLHRDQAVAGLFRAAGHTTLLAGVLSGAWILVAMATDPVRARNRRGWKGASASDLPLPDRDASPGRADDGKPTRVEDRWDGASGSTPSDTLFGPTRALTERPDSGVHAPDPLPHRPPDPDLSVPTLPQEVVEQALREIEGDSRAKENHQALSAELTAPTSRGSSARKASLQYLEEKAEAEGLTQAETRFLNWLRRQERR